MNVAQSCTLLYRRIAFCEGRNPWNPQPKSNSLPSTTAVQQSKTLRYEPERSHASCVSVSRPLD
jgi:hypothetical protein